MKRQTLKEALEADKRAHQHEQSEAIKIAPSTNNAEANAAKATPAIVESEVAISLPRTETRVCEEPDKADCNLVLNEKEEKARELSREILQLGQTVLEKAITLGGLLEELKQQMGHGSWTTYVEETIGIQARTASNYMRIFREKDRFRAESGEFVDVGIGEALKLMNKKTDHPQPSEGTSSSNHSAIPPGPEVPSSGKPMETTRLADGSTYICNHKWNSRSPLKWCDVESALGSLKEKDLPEPVVAIRQRLFLALAETINGQSEKDRSSLEAGDLQATFEAMIRLTEVKTPNSSHQTEQQ